MAREVREDESVERQAALCKRHHATAFGASNDLELYLPADANNPAAPRLFDRITSWNFN